jgi:hypothetical protein
LWWVFYTDEHDDYQSGNSRLHPGISGQEHCWHGFRMITTEDTQQTHGNSKNNVCCCDIYRGGNQKNYHLKVAAGSRLFSPAFLVSISIIVL